MKIFKVVGAVFGVFALACSVHVYAAGATNNNINSNTECPVGLVSGLTLDEEFGAGVNDLTRCLTTRHNLNVAVEINRKCRNWADTTGAGPCTSGGPDALGNMTNVLNDYEITNGMTQGLDYTMIAIVHGGGGRLLINDPVANPYRDQIIGMMERGVTFYFCQNTVRGFIRGGILQNPQTTGISVKDQLIPGVRYVTAGFSAVADVQQSGWSVITP